MRNGFLCLLAVLGGTALAQAQSPYYGPSYPYSPAQTAALQAGYPQNALYNPLTRSYGYAPTATVSYPAYWPAQPYTPPPSRLTPVPTGTPAAPPVTSLAVLPPAPRGSATPSGLRPSLYAPPGSRFGPPANPYPPVLAPPDSTYWTCQAPQEKLFWLSADFALFSLRPAPVPGPLVTTGFVGDFPNSGGLGQPGTTVRFGNDDIAFDKGRGLKASVGVWLDCHNTWALEFAGFWMGDQNNHFAIASDGTGNPVITRPFFNTETGAQGGFINTFPNPVPGDPGILIGGTQIDSFAKLLGGEVNGSFHIYHEDWLHAEFLTGFRVLRLQEQLRIQDEINSPFGALQFLGTPVAPDETLRIQDRFATSDTFYGLQLGAKLQWRKEWLFCSLFSKAAVGLNDQRVVIDGTTRLISATRPQTAEGGVLALPTNIGDYKRTRFGLVSETGLDMGVDLTSWLRLRAGYSFLLWTGVVRPGDQINLMVSPSQAPQSPFFGLVAGTSDPKFQFKSQTFWTHIVNLGLEVYY